MSATRSRRAFLVLAGRSFRLGLVTAQVLHVSRGDDEAYELHSGAVGGEVPLGEVGHGDSVHPHFTDLCRRRHRSTIWRSSGTVRCGNCSSEPTRPQRWDRSASVPVRPCPPARCRRVRVAGQPRRRNPDRGRYRRPRRSRYRRHHQRCPRASETDAGRGGLWFCDRYSAKVPGGRGREGGDRRLPHPQTGRNCSTSRFLPTAETRLSVPCA